MLKIRRFMGLAASVGVISLWGVFGLLNPYDSRGLTTGAYIVVALMIILAIAGLVAALMDKPYVMLAVFGLSFIPVGLYWLSTPGIFKGIGVLNLLFLLSALLSLLGRGESAVGGEPQINN